MKWFDDFCKFISWLYIQYSLVTALNILDASERYVFNMTLIFILMLSSYSAYTYLPDQLYSYWQFFNSKFIR